VNINTQIHLLKIGNIIAVIATIIINILANSLPLNDKFTGELSDSYPNLFVPAGITFAIWGIIYVLLILFALYQIKDFSKQTTKSPRFIEKIGVLFIIGSIGNIAWIFFWHYEQVLLSLGAMILLFASLLGIYLRLDIGNSKSTRQEFLFVHIPFSVYLGWISVATIANITALLVDINWQGFGVSPGIWTMLILAVVILLTCIMLFKRKDIAYSLVIIWALTGIALKRMENDPVFGIRQDISNTAIIGILIIFIAIIYTLFHYSKKRKS
jgi:hypothetical protein